VRAKGGRVVNLSSLHVTGEQLHQLGGVAALLRFPLEIDAEEEELPPDDEAVRTTGPPQDQQGAGWGISFFTCRLSEPEGVIDRLGVLV
jgi:hypothetical protein